MAERGGTNPERSSLNRAPTPMVDALLKGRDLTKRQLQALPLSGGASLEGSAYMARYQELFGLEQLRTDAVFAGAAFDSFFFPETVIREAEVLAAEAFEAHGALFVTSGTTVSNQITIATLLEPGRRVLADRCCHQSIHFALYAARVRTDYLEPVYECEATGRSWWDLDELIDRVSTAQEQGEPYHALILNGSSYDGIVYRLPEVLEALAARGARVANLLVDEAWGSFGYFHPTMSACTAMRAARIAERMGTNVIATHSLHKSMSCLRQASLILWQGDLALATKLQHARYKIHTTSPSYPILVSMDLARAQMVDEGAELTSQAETLAKDLEARLGGNPRTSRCHVNRTILPQRVAEYAMLDPTKVSINVGAIGRSPDEVKRFLHERHGIWIRRSTARSILPNIHIGVREADIAAVEIALEDLQHQALQNPSGDEGGDGVSSHFVIPYPPGIPILMPGDRMSATSAKRIADARAAGAHVFSIA